MKKIVFVIESLHCGGAEKSLVTLLKNLDLKKYTVDLVITTEGGDFQKFVPKKVDIHVLDILSNKNKFLVLFLRLVYLIRKKLNKNFHPAQLYWKTFGHFIKNNKKTYDIAIAYNQGFSTYFVSEKINAKTKYAWLNTDYRKAGYNILFDYPFYKNFSRIVCVSVDCETTFQNEIKRLNKRLSTTIIKDISDKELINKLSLENNGLPKDNNIVLLTIGRLAKAKGYNLAIEACEILISKGYRLKWYIIGDGPLRKELEGLIKGKEIENNFVLLGYKENPYPYIKNCDIYVQTSLFEGLGLTVIEAAILQKPIVTTNFPTAYTIIENGKTGLICDMTPMSISEAIMLYMDNPGFKQKVVKNLMLLENNDKEISLSKIRELLDS